MGVRIKLIEKTLFQKGSAHSLSSLQLTATKKNLTKIQFKDVPNCEELGINGPLRLSRKFTMPSIDEDETFAMFNRTVKSIRYVDMQLGNIIVPF